MQMLCHLSKEFKHPWILVLRGSDVLEQFVRILRDNCTQVNK
jgi:hypothetical protein